MIEEKKKLQLLAEYGLILIKGWYWLKGDNMPPRKLFSTYMLERKNTLWLLFRIYGLCRGKYVFFNKNANIWLPVSHRGSNGCGYKHIAVADGFKNVNTGEIVLLSTLARIHDIEQFEDLMSDLS